MTPEDHARAAANLLEAEKSGAQIGLLSLRHPDITMDDAYAIQSALASAKLAESRRIIGWKIGLTSKAMQDADFVVKTIHDFSVPEVKREKQLYM